ncbi:hypothetical protein CFE53_01780 [Methanofervidicoccus sp. A16]|uniref:hypothetical protein n=1 Tax=Methanofervidicoccus sp. A16 TaxID=2607662 RepID=UPI00118BEC6B|nr:hypothetical protein [Methanofervidicoccus sp. A16]AXI24950.1 hypothetical protein CFE53_01780 [Methanofervidicoccus sp. A16]
MLSLNRSVLLVFILLLVIDGISAYNFGYIKINYKENCKAYNFQIDKVENYTYNLTFEHYGNIDKGMGVKIYLNGKLICTIGGGGRGFTWDVKRVKIDVTDCINNGSNTLRIEGMNLRADPERRYYPYYVLDGVRIDEPFTVKVPVSIVQVVICVIVMMVVSVRYFKKYRFD